MACARSRHEGPSVSRSGPPAWLAVIAVVVIAVAVIPNTAGASGGPVLVSSSALQPDAYIFMLVGASPAQIAGVEDVVSHLPQVRRYALVDQMQALRQFRQIFRKKPNLLRGVTAAELPQSIDVETTHRDCVSARAIQTKVGSLPGVDTVGYPKSLNCVPMPRVSAARNRQCKGSGYNVEVFMQLSATPDEVQRVESLIEQRRDVLLVHVINQNRALSIYRCVFAGNPELLSGVTADQLPIAFEVDAPTPAAARAFKVAVRSLPGVDTTSS